MNQYENLSIDQAEIVMNMMISEQKRIRFEMNRKKRIKRLQTLPKTWNTLLVIASLLVIGFGLYLEIRFIAIISSIVILFSITQFTWRLQSRHLVNKVLNERFEN